MKQFYKKAVGTIAAVGLAFSAYTATTFASTSNIIGGDLKFDAAKQPVVTDFQDVTSNGQIQTTSAAISDFTVIDARGTGAGWRLFVKADQFQAADGVPTTLSQNSLTIAKPEVTAHAGADDINTLTVTGNTQIDNADGVHLISAGIDGGMGSYDVSFGAEALTLSLEPKDVKEGLYTSTIHITLLEGPQ